MQRKKFIRLYVSYMYKIKSFYIHHPQLNYNWI
jgi:hypothetical protein